MPWTGAIGGYDGRCPVRFTYSRLYADDQGESHFDDVEVELTAANFAPPAPPLYLSPSMAATQFGFLGAPTGWDGSAWHPTPTRQIFITVAGTYQVTASDGTVRDFPVGTVLLLEDTTGKGHSTRNVGEGECFIALAQLPNEPT